MDGIHRPKKSLVNSSVKALFAPKAKVKEQPKVQKPGLVPSVPLARHEERDKDGNYPCLFSASLKGKFPDHALLLVTSKTETDLRFYVRAHPPNFRETVNGISILNTIAAGANLNNTREVDLQEVAEEEANLTHLEMVIRERYMSKRDLWHLHLAMMQHKGEIMYRDFERNLRQHIPRSKITQLKTADGAVTCGRVSPNTDVVLRTGSANLFVFVQVSLELLEFSLAGRPRWYALLGCLRELIEKSLRTRADSGDGHYVRFVMFSRMKTRVRPGLRRGVSPPSSPPSINRMVPSNVISPVRKPSIANAGLLNDLEPLDLDEEPESFRDYYEIFWEGVARSLPPTEQLLRRIVRMCTRLQEEYCEACTGKSAPRYDDSMNDCMAGIRAQDLCESGRGNILEACNVALDHYDQHHLDRSLRVTGQKIVMLTAGSGIIHATSRQLYELTHRRFMSCGPSSDKAFHMICLRQPACHDVPYICWPTETANIADDVGPTESLETLPHTPPWIDLTYHRDVDWSTRYSPDDWVRSSFQPLEAWQNKYLYVPEETEEDKGDEIIPMNVDEPKKVCNAVISDPSKAPIAPTEKFLHSSLRRTGEELWKEIRLPVLRPYFRRTSEVRIEEFDVGRYTDSYTLQPSRFDTNVREEMIQTMMDLIGCRLEARTSELCYGGEETDGATSDVASSIGPAATSPFGEGALVSQRDRKPEGSEEPWQIRGNQIPKALRSGIVRSANGRIEWRMKGDDNGLTVYYRDETNTAQANVELVYPYECAVRRHCVMNDVPDEARVKEDGLGWTPCKRIFHMPLRPSWNSLDCIIAGTTALPPALPYPVSSVDDARADDRCAGWQLRSAIKQHLLMLVPVEGADQAHRELFDSVSEHLEGAFTTGEDPFEVVENNSLPLPGDASARGSLLERFRKVMDGLDKLCFTGGQGKPSGWETSMNVKVVDDGSEFMVSRRNCCCYVKNSELETAHGNSRDWFELFYDSIYSPPKPWILALQWMTCSSVHLVNFRDGIRRLARDHGFIWVRLPIAQLFPQPAPHWVWSEERQTNFDRLLFHAPKVIPIDSNICGPRRQQLNGELLKCWLGNPLGFLFVFSSPQEDFLVDKTVEVALGHFKDKANLQLFQRLQGWVLCHRSGSHLVALREAQIYWYDNRLAYTDFCDAEEKFRTVEQCWREFHTSTMEVINRYRRRR